jgi:hypothetical protein
MTVTKQKLLFWMLGATLVVPIVSFLLIFLIAQFAPAQIDWVVVPGVVLGFFYLPTLAAAGDAKVVGNTVAFLSALSFWWLLATATWFIAGGRVVRKREAL